MMIYKSVHNVAYLIIKHFDKCGAFKFPDYEQRIELGDFFVYLNLN